MPQSPNLIYVFADQLRYQACGFAGDVKAQTPNMDRLAAASVNFINATSSHPMCAPYRAALFTGKYSSSTGMVINKLRLNPAHHRALGQVLTQWAALNDTIERCTWYRDHWTADRIFQRTATTL